MKGMTRMMAKIAKVMSAVGTRKTNTRITMAKKMRVVLAKKMRVAMAKKTVKKTITVMAKKTKASKSHAPFTIPNLSCSTTITLLLDSPETCRTTGRQL